MTTSPANLSRIVAGGLATRLPAPDPSGHQPSHRRFTGAALVADASGFTALTADLEAQLGSRGADRLAGLMTEILGRAVEMIETHGGLVVEFAGDSVQAVWLNEGSGLAHCRAQAEAAAAAIVEWVRADGADAMPLQVGVGTGEIDAAILGGVNDRWDTLVWGSALKRAMTPGGGDDGQSAALAGFQARTEIVNAADLSLLLPDALRGMTEAQVVGWSAELRHLTVMFCRLLPPQSVIDAQTLHGSIRRMQEIAARHDGVLDKVVVEEKGVMAVVGFGLPPSPTEGAAERAAAAALEARAILPDSSIGIATGKVFAGVVGGRGRAQYTIYGPAANRAARLMAAAGRAALCDEETRLAAANAATFSRRLLSLKGLGATHAHALSEALEVDSAVKAAEPSKLVGRADVQTRIEGFISDRDDARVLAVCGAAGLGKSVLKSIASTYAPSQGRPVLDARPVGFAAHEPLKAWRGQARARLRAWGQARGMDDPTAHRALVVEAGFPADLAALANPLFRDALPEGARLAALPGDERASLAPRLQADLMIRLVGAGALIIFDDVDRSDAASLALAEAMLRADPSARLLVTSRDGDAMVLTALLKHWDPLTLRIDLRPLDRAATASLARMVVPVADDHPLADWLYNQCQGNPQLACELLRALPADALAAAALSPGAWREALPALGLAEMPPTIEAAIMARVGRATPAAQALLKAASVLGGRFEEGRLLDLDAPGGAEGVKTALAELTRDGLIVRDHGRYRFDQELVRATVHGNLTATMKRDLHTRAALALERAGRFERAAELAEHWREAERPTRAFRYARRAGRQAMAAGASGDAVQFYRQAASFTGIESLRGHSAVRRLAQSHADLVEGLANIGEHNQVIVEGRAALEALGVSLPRSTLGWSGFALSQGFALCRAVLKGRPDPWSRRDRHLARLKVRTSNWLVGAEVFRSGGLVATALALYTAKVAERHDDVVQAGRVYGLLGYVAGMARLGALSRFCFNRPRAGAIATRDWAQLQFSLFCERWLHMTFGRWAPATRLGPILRGLGRRAFSDLGTALAIGHQEHVEFFCGDVQAALASCEKLRAMGARLGNDQILTWSLEARSHCHLALGDPVSAVADVEAAQKLLGRSPENMSSIITAGLAASARARLGQFDRIETDALLSMLEDRSAWSATTLDAFNGAAEAIIAMDSVRPGRTAGRSAARILAILQAYARLFPLGGPALAFHTGAAAFRVGRFRAAATVWRRGVSLSERLGMRLEEARLLDSLAVCPARHPSHRARDRARADELIAACNAVVPPRLYEDA